MDIDIDIDNSEYGDTTNCSSLAVDLWRVHDNEITKP